MIYDHTIAIRRLIADSDNLNKESYQLNAALQAVRCQIQPASPEDTIIANGVFGQTHICFTTNSGILSGDHITVSGTGQQFRVRGVEDWSQIEGAPHFELTLIRFEEEMEI